LKRDEFNGKRIRLGLTQTELAEMLDMKPNTISRYETGNLSISKVVELAIEAIENRMVEETELVQIKRI
jgi:transcriptional regulator with XRE-family HTH domain